LGHPVLTFCSVYDERESVTHSGMDYSVPIVGSTENDGHTKITWGENAGLKHDGPSDKA